MVNKIILIGHIGKDPEQPRETKTGLKVLDLSLATKKRSKDDGVDWHAITCFGKTAEIAHKYLSKGRQVYIEGRLTYDSWEDKETGKQRKKAKIICDSIQFLGSKDQNTESPKAAPRAKATPSSYDYDNVPF